MRTLLAVTAFFLFAVVGFAQEPAASKSTATPAPRNDINGDPLPDGAVARVGTCRLRCAAGAGMPVLAFSADGKSLVSIGDDGIFHWDTATGRLRRRVQGPPRGPRGPDLPAIALSADATIAAYWTPNAIRIWDPSAGKQRAHIVWLLKRLAGFPGIALSADGRLLAVTPDLPLAENLGRFPWRISLWDTRTGDQKRLIAGLPNFMTALTLSHDGRTLVALDEDHTLWAWDVESGKQRLRIPSPHEERFTSVAVSGDDKMVAVGVYRSRPHASESVLSFRNLADGKIVHPLPVEAENAWIAAFSPDGRLLATFQANDAGGEQRLTVWDLHRGQPVRRLPGPGRPGISQLLFGPDGNLLAGCLVGSPQIRLWNVQSGHELPAPPGNANAVTSLFFLRHGSSVLTHAETRLKLWDAKTGAVQRLPEKSDAVAAVAATFDRKRMLSLDVGGRARVWDADTGKTVHSSVINQNGLDGNDLASRLAGAALTAAGRTLFTFVARSGAGSEDWTEMNAWDTTTGKQTHHWKMPDERGALFSPDARLIVSAEGVVRETDTGREVCRLSAQPPTSSSAFEGALADPAAFSRDGRLLAATMSNYAYSGGVEFSQHVMQVWELASRQLVFSTDPIREVNSRVLFSNDGRLLLSAGPAGINVWDTATGRLLLERDGIHSDVIAAQLSPDGRRFATALADTTVLIWDVDPAVLAAGKTTAPATTARFDPSVLWTDLASKDARRGQAAVWALVAAPDKSASWLGNHLHAAEPVAADRVRQFVADLGSPRFAERERAVQELRKLDGQVEAALRRALADKPSPETRERIERLLAEAGRATSPDRLREIRALQVLEAMATPAAIDVLNRLAKGGAGARLTRDARESLERLGAADPR